ncbi:MAG: hypothetical protein EOM54_02330 [Clostridia bacterium]|nr:hypothetical protein [Clostridia bacterium]
MDAVLSATDDLAISMSQMLELLKKLMESAKKKEDLIIADDVEGLSELLSEETETSCAVRQKEKELKYRADQLRRAAGIGNKVSKLREICDAVCDPDGRERLIAAGNNIAESVEWLGCQNEKLRALLRQRIGYADYMLNILHSPRSSLCSYDMLGNRGDDSGGFCLLDYHA